MMRQAFTEKLVAERTAAEKLRQTVGATALARGLIQSRMEAPKNLTGQNK
jgi:hypothetical protein